MTIPGAYEVTHPVWGRGQLAYVGYDENFFSQFLFWTNNYGDALFTIQHIQKFKLPVFSVVKPEVTSRRKIFPKSA